MAENINDLPKVNYFKVSVDSKYVHILHNGYELVTTSEGWEELQTIVNEKRQEHEKSNEC